MIRKVLIATAAVVLAAFVAIQLVPYGRDHTNPPTTGEPAWDSATTRATADAACFDCHSNETRWPWYANVAPISWRLQQHVDEGREQLNFSEWGTGEQESDEIVEVVRDGEMPPWDYLLMHPEARLAGAERDAFLAGLMATFGAGEGDDPSGGGEGEDDSGDGD